MPLTIEEREAVTMAKSLMRYEQSREKKRFEAAKDILCAMLANDKTWAFAKVSDAVRKADELLAQLEK